MTDSDAHPDVPRPALWFGLLGGAAAWTAHLLSAYLIAEFGCVAGADRTLLLEVMLPAWLLLGMSLMTAGLAAGAAWVSGRALRRLKQQARDKSPPLSADLYMARSGFYMSGLFMFIITVQSIPTFFYLQGC